MTPSKIIEGNTLIAEFMQREYESIYDLNYRCSWDWLMPVAEKIENITISGKEELIEGTGRLDDVIYSFWVEISYNQCTVNREMTPLIYGTDKDFLDLYDCKRSSKIESTWIAVVEFIKWYNQQNQNQ